MRDGRTGKEKIVLERRLGDKVIVFDLESFCRTGSPTIRMTSSVLVNARTYHLLSWQGRRVEKSRDMRTGDEETLDNTYGINVRQHVLSPQLPVFYRLGAASGKLSFLFVWHSMTLWHPLTHPSTHPNVLCS